jgi:hypothetical protein
LIASNITMLRDFGFVTVIDLTVSLCGVLLVLPAVLAIAEGGAVAFFGEFGRRGGALTARLRRRPEIA